MEFVGNQRSGGARPNQPAKLTQQSWTAAKHMAYRTVAGKNGSGSLWGF